MREYQQFAQFYDALIGDGSSRSARILEAIDRSNVDATSLLELGCGTGSVMEGLVSIPRLVGLDASAEMLSAATVKVPSAEFLLGDMTDFDLGTTFDVVACVYDTVNHLVNYEAWESLFRGVARHLEPGGLFIFDLNTIGRLHQLVASPPWVHDFDGNTLIMDVRSDGGELTVWDIRVFASAGDGKFTLHQENIRELGVALETVRATLATYFDLLHEEDDSGDPPTDESSRAYFVYRRQG
ncbi:MAG: class I SAM-dependent DNA methyltransferase [Acidimicrobiales bacterium]